jgi:hypothetical protein
MYTASNNPAAARSRPSDTPSSRHLPARPSILSAPGPGYAAHPSVQYTYVEREITSSGPPNTLFPKEPLDVSRHGEFPTRKSSLKNPYARHESKTSSDTSQLYSQQSERSVDVQGGRRRPTQGSKIDKEWVEPNDEDEEELTDSADSQHTSDHRRAHTAGANVGVHRRSDGGFARSRIPVPAAETAKERSPRPPSDPRSWSDQRGSNVYANPKEPERNIQLSQETLPKVTQTTMLPYRNIPEGRSKDSRQRHDGYRGRDRYGAEGGLSSSFDRKRGDDDLDDDPDPDPDPDPDQPASGGTIGFSQRHPGSRLFQENALGTSTRRPPEGRHSPDPKPGQPDGPYGFLAGDPQAQDSQLRPDARLRGDGRSRATPPETERSSVSRPAGQYHTDQRDVTATSRDQRSERPPEPPRRRSTHYYTSSGTKKDDRDIYDRHKRQG